MAHRLRPVGQEFASVAPVRLVFEREITAAPPAVFDALARDVGGWTAWFRVLTLARPLDGGAGREIRLLGAARFRETILAAEEPDVYAYRVDVTNVPGARAMVEEWRLEPAGTGTRVRWTMAVDGVAPFRLAMKAGRLGLAAGFRDAMTSLDRRLAG
ncbi:SRPBCC family protein [Streptomyces althioticus]|uniref:Polyketide cyclase n=1 Tax=Streptomyces griseorubens TaxID=66897 RepID=A0ABR4T859_9ACTN|nr:MULTISPECIES: SRPBCC family protein [Actinomycetes]MCC9684696.1 SRPBCC family protein [Streptomyces sp. MNU103]GGQ65758.1 polyketide cyclase [Streptomyces althioticus]GGT43766.1 polyketide cyclase [Streptomyces matensis]KEG43634.1 polyketide cyclase [Streptomyces griseorubens]MBM4832307.1 SRPBCC family protein [Actinospica acidiphila]